MSFIMRTMLTTDNRTTLFQSKIAHRRYWLRVLLFMILGLLASIGLLFFRQPVAIDSPSFIPIIQRRLNAVTAMLIAAICQSLATIAFQSITHNRIVTPSILGFDAIYNTLHTVIIFFWGSTVFVESESVSLFLLQMGLMIGICLLLFTTLLSSRHRNLQVMLLMGIIIGGGLRSFSSFLRKLLAPSEFDLLQAKLFGSVTHAKPDYLPIAIVIVITSSVLLFCLANRLNLLSLGKETASSLGVNERVNTLYILIIVALLMSVSTALVGPLNFYGFLVAALTYQLTATYHHRYLFIMSVTIGFSILTNAYFIMYHIFNAQGVVSVLIELLGGIAFISMILKKGTL